MELLLFYYNQVTYAFQVHLLAEPHTSPARSRKTTFAAASSPPIWGRPRGPWVSSRSVVTTCSRARLLRGLPKGAGCRLCQCFPGDRKCSCNLGYALHSSTTFGWSGTIAKGQDGLQWAGPDNISPQSRSTTTRTSTHVKNFVNNVTDYSAKGGRNLW